MESRIIVYNVKVQKLDVQNKFSYFRGNRQLKKMEIIDDLKK